MQSEIVVYRGGGLAGFNPPPRNLEGPPKSRQTQLLKIAEFRTPTPQDVRKKGSKILKLPPVRNCFTLTMTNKLVVIINSLKVPKIKKILLYEMKFIIPNYSCPLNPWLGDFRPQIPVLSVLCPQLNLLNPPNKISGYATGPKWCNSAEFVASAWSRNFLAFCGTQRFLVAIQPLPLSRARSSHSRQSYSNFLTIDNQYYRHIKT